MAQRSRLHPSKIRGGLQRRWFELRVEPRGPNAPGIVTVGNERYGGWLIPGDLVEPSWVCYSLGAGGDTSFDLDLIQRYGVTVCSVEPVPAYVQKAILDANGDTRFVAIEAAVTTVDGPVRMQVTHDAGSRSVSSAGLYESEVYVEYPGRTLDSLMRERGYDHIDLLKIDVEGAEYELIPTLDLRGLEVKVLALQLHHTGSVRQARQLIRSVTGQGYELVAHQPTVKLTFLRA
jgi:FkbM family methyltransferase